MPSLREVNMEKAKAERLERLKLSRRFGASLGVEGARRYDFQKRQQEVAVLNDVRGAVIEQKAAELRGQSTSQAEMSLRKGEGMRGAQEYSASVAAKATVESRAWEAERRLERARYGVALRKGHLLQEGAASGSAGAAENRARARVMEAERTAHVLARSASSVPFVSLAVPLEDGPSAVSLANHRGASNMADVTARFEQRRQEELAAKQRKLDEERRKGEDRSKRVLRERRHEEYLDRIERENEAMLKKSMLEHAMRSIRPMASHDLQQQDARRSTHLAGRAQKEFEDIFLSGPWRRDTIGRSHIPPPAEGTPSGDEDVFGADDEFAVFRPCSVEVLLQGTPSVGLPVEQLFAKVVMMEGDEDDALIGNDDDPTPNQQCAPIPMAPEGASSRGSSRGDHVVHDTTGSSSSSGGLPPMAPSRFHTANESSIHQTDATVASTIPDENAYLEDRNKQFLQQLAVLQRRLVSAKTLTAPLHNTQHNGGARRSGNESHTESDTSQDASSSNTSVDVSPMSSPERENNRQHASGADRRSASTGGGARLAMTTDQLRRAIQRMKLSNKHLDSDESDMATSL